MACYNGDLLAVQAGFQLTTINKLIQYPRKCSFFGL